MSKLLRANLPVAATFLLILQLFNNSSAQKISATIFLDANAKKAFVDGKIHDINVSETPRNLAFLKDYAAIDNLGERIADLALMDGDGREVGFRKLIPGEFLAEKPFVSGRYAVDLTPRKDPAASSHVSWIRDDSALIFLGDLLPQFSSNGPVGVDVQFKLPTGWEIYTTEKDLGGLSFQVANATGAVFVAGKGMRNQTINSANPAIKLFTSGDWQFTDEDAAGMVGEIFASYRRVFGADPATGMAVVLLKFPVAVNNGSWEADTRGSTVSIVSSDMPFKTQALQRLHEQLRHEMFHLWIPNGIHLTGRYDWFYEGFALYFSLKNGVLLNRIRFDDLLDTLSRAYTIDRAQDPRMSLIDASLARWRGGNIIVYARGLITAFLCDVALLNSSGRKADVSVVLREIFNKYRNTKELVDGTEAVLKVLASHPELIPIIDKYIKGNSSIDWTDDLQKAGILSEEKNYVTALRTVEKPDGRQREILDRLGYNSWRKVGIPSK
ncbi:MAG: hypothetical protein ABI999_17650 [Acidobacteriota bacterium]